MSKYSYHIYNVLSLVTMIGSDVALQVCIDLCNFGIQFSLDISGEGYFLFHKNWQNLGKWRLYHKTER